MKRALITVALIVAGSASAYADTMTNCISLSSMPDAFTKSSATHVEIGAWHEAEAGCGATGASARPTRGPYGVQYFADGSELLSFFKAGFEACGRTQVDVRWRDELGQLYRYDDFVVDTGTDCLGLGQFATETGQGSTIGIVPGPDPGDTPGPCTGCVTVPVPEPEPWALILLGLMGYALVLMTYAVWRVR